MDLNRTVVIGNSGSGKSWLAEHIAGRLGSDWVDLDHIHWYPGGYGAARPREEAVALIKQAAQPERWVMEGIYGWLVSEVLTYATTLIWLRLPIADCVQNIQNRGIRRGGTAEAFAALLRWAESYESREGSSSYSGHEHLFNSFSGNRVCLTSRAAVTAFVKG